MFFKVNKKSSLGLQIEPILRRLNDSHFNFLAYAQNTSDLGQDASYIKSPHYLGGVLLAIQFKEHPGKDWAQLKDKSFYGRRFFYPKHTRKKTPSKLESEFKAYNDPIDFDELNSLFGIKQGAYRGFTWFRCPGVTETKEEYLITIDYDWYNSSEHIPTDLIEIKESEYKQLIIKNESQ